MLKFSKTNKSILLDERLMAEGGGGTGPLCSPPRSATAEYSYSESVASKSHAEGLRSS